MTDADFSKANEKAELKFVFEAFDTDSNDRLDRETLIVLCQALKLSAPEIELELPIWVTTLSFDQFVRIFSSHKEHIDNLVDTFRSFDLHDDGYIDAKDLKQIFSEFGIDTKNEEMDSIIKQCDKNANGKIDFKKYLEAGSACFVVRKPVGNQLKHLDVDKKMDDNSETSDSIDEYPESLSANKSVDEKDGDEIEWRIDSVEDSENVEQGDEEEIETEIDTEYEEQIHLKPLKLGKDVTKGLGLEDESDSDSMIGPSRNNMSDSEESDNGLCRCCCNESQNERQRVKTNSNSNVKSKRKKRKGKGNGKGHRDRNPSINSISQSIATDSIEMELRYRESIR